MMAGGQVIGGNFPPSTPPVEGPEAELLPVQGEQTPEASLPAAPDKYAGDDEPIEFNPAMRLLKNIFRPIRDFFGWIGRGVRSSQSRETQSHKTQPPATVDVLPEISESSHDRIFLSQAGTSIRAFLKNDYLYLRSDGPLLRSDGPFDLANLLEIIESDGRRVHKSLGQIAEAMMALDGQESPMRRFTAHKPPEQRFTIAGGMFSVKPNYDYFSNAYEVKIRPVNDPVLVDRFFTAIDQFKWQSEIDVVERVDFITDFDSYLSIGDILHILSDVFDDVFWRYAKHLGVDEDSGDPRLRRMLNVKSMISEPVPSDISLEENIRVLEVGVRENSEGEVTAFILRFVKGEPPTEEGVDFNNVITWVGKIDGATGKITWYYHEVVSDPGYVSSATSPVFLATRNVLKKLISPQSWDSIKYGVELDTEGSNGSGSGVPTPGSPATPATPAAGPQAAPAAGGGPIESASTAAPIDEDTEITAAPDEYFEVKYEGYSGDEESFIEYVDAETDEWSDDYDASWMWGTGTAIGAEAFPVY